VAPFLNLPLDPMHKTNLILSVAIAFSLSCALPAQTWIKSPVNGHYYAVLAPDTWKNQEAKAVALGGHLATVRSQAEQDWIRKSFGNRHLNIGFTDEAIEGKWVWISGESVSYTNWCPPEPNNGRAGNYCHMTILWGCGGRWNDWGGGSGSTGYLEGLVERGGPPMLAAYTSFGTGCASTSLPTELTATTLPKIDTTFNLRVSNLGPFAPGILLFGFSDTTWGGVPLPLDLTFLGMSGCNLLVSWDLQVGFFPSGGKWDLPLTLPNDPTLEGLTFYNQAWVLDPKANAFGVGTSNGGKGVIGY
jgi:hypothetical protein